MYENTEWGNLRQRLTDVLRAKLHEVENVLPVFSLSQVRAAASIYADLTTDYSSAVAVYHHAGTADWLADHGEPLEKLRSINALDAKRFIDLVEHPLKYPAALLHEIAHAFHDNILESGFLDENVERVHVIRARNNAEKLSTPE